MKNSRLGFLTDMDWKKAFSIIIRFGCGAGTAKLLGYDLLSPINFISGIISVFVTGIPEKMVLDGFSIKQAVSDSLSETFSVALIIIVSLIFEWQ